METVTRKAAEKTLFYGTNNKKHICETLRMIYDVVYLMKQDGDNVMRVEEMEELLIDAMMMAKKMQARLSYYQKTYNDDTGNKAINIIGLAGTRARAKMRRARINEKI